MELKLFNKYDKFIHKVTIPDMKDYPELIWYEGIYYLLDEIEYYEVKGFLIIEDKK